MAPKPSNLVETVAPKYLDLAMIPNGKDLQTNAFMTAIEIENFVNRSPKYQTINRMLKGSPGKYTGVHRVFTAINAKMGGVLSRKDHVLLYDEGSKVTTVDPSLEECAVFPRLPDIMAKISMTASGVGDAAAVATYQVNHMIAGRPVSRNLVVAVFEAVGKKLGNPLSLNDEIFN